MSLFVIPAKAGTQDHCDERICLGFRSWVPAFAGMTVIA